MGPRIYNLFPLLFGDMSKWPDHLQRVAAMGFNWVYVNPLHYPGFSGSLYAVKDYYALNPLIATPGRSADDDLRALAAAARSASVDLMMDLVINHTAKDSLLAESHPEWFAHNPDGSIMSPHAVDPGDASKVTVWGDLAEIDYGNERHRDALVSYWIDLVRRHLKLGFRGFRCDAAYKVPAQVWSRVIAAAKQAEPAAVFAAETLGCRNEQIEALAHAGFDYNFNSVKWWDIRAPWAPEQYERFRRLAPSIGFADSHDTARLAGEPPQELATASDVKRYCEMRYALAASFSTGVMMTGGFEYGFRRPLNVVTTRASDWEEPWFDLSDAVARINRAKAACAALNEEGPMRHLEREGCAIVSRSTNDGAAHALFVANLSTTVGTRINVESVAAELRLRADELQDSLLHQTTVSGLTLDLGPLDWRILASHGGTPATT